MNVTLGNRIIPLSQRQSQLKEVVNAQVPPTEYDILQHLDRTLARVSILELIKKSPSHQSTLLQFLQNIMVNEDLPTSGVTKAIMALTCGPSISFSDKDLAPPESRSLPQCLTVTLNEVKVDSTLIDTGASINVCPMKIIQKINLQEENLEEVYTTISTYDNSKWYAKGKVTLKLGLGPVVMSSDFFILDIDPAYKAILGRPWIEQTLGIPSML